MKKQELEKILENHKKWLIDEDGECADLRDAYLTYANLMDANLRGADLRGANLDFSCWPLWCGSKDMIVDEKIAEQLAAHGAVIDVRRSEKCTDDEWQAATDWQAACEKLGKFSHRASELELE